MPDLHKIPVPWSQRLRSIRFRVLPILIFLGAVAGTAYIWNRQFSVMQAVGEVYARRIDLAVQKDGVLLESPIASGDYTTESTPTRFWLGLMMDQRWL